MVSTTRGYIQSARKEHWKIHLRIKFQGKEGVNLWVGPSRRVCHEWWQHSQPSQAWAGGTRALVCFGESWRLLIPHMSWGQQRLPGVSLSPTTIALSLPAVWLPVVALLCSGFRVGWHFRVYGIASRKERRKNWGLGEKETAHCSLLSTCGSQDLGNLFFLALTSDASVVACVPLGDWWGPLLYFSSRKR